MRMKLFERLLWCAFIVLAILSSLSLYYTYTNESYKRGDPSLVSSNLCFLLQSETLVLEQKSDNSAIYECEIEYASVYQVCSDFDANKNEYYMELNGYLFSQSLVAGHAEGTLDFTFLGTQNEILLNDKLYMIIDFYSNRTNVYVYTEGGYEAFSYWLSYFNTYGFDLRVYEKI